VRILNSSWGWVCRNFANVWCKNRLRVEYGQPVVNFRSDYPFLTEHKCDGSDVQKDTSSVTVLLTELEHCTLQQRRVVKAITNFDRNFICTFYDCDVCRRFFRKQISILRPLRNSSEMPWKALVSITCWSVCAYFEQQTTAFINGWCFMLVFCSWRTNGVSISVYILQKEHCKYSVYTCLIY